MKDKYTVINVDAKPYEIVLHIGAPKTGSSALQHFLFENRAVLLDKGFYYPNHGFDVNGVSGGHSGIGASLIERDAPKAQSILDRYIADAQRKGLTLLVSAESLYSFPRQVKDLCGNDMRVRVISFFRDPLESIVSSYNQSVKRHYNTNTLDDYCLGMLGGGNKSASGMLLYDWADGFGKDNLTVLNYTKPVSADAALEKTLLSELGITELDDFNYSTKPINRGYEVLALEFKRLLNLVIDNTRKPENQSIDYLLQEISDNQSTEFNNSASYLSNATYQTLTDQFGVIAEKVRAEFISTSSSSKNLINFSPDKVLDEEGVLFYAKSIKAKDIMTHSYILSCLEKVDGENHDINYLKTLYSKLE